jgi:prepilin-type N-terminal cleavage/methylation domain-containing protein
MLHGCKRHRRTCTHDGPVSARAGFTIIEMMIAVVIIGVMAAAIAPALGEAMASRRHSAAPYRLIHAARLAQARAKDTGVAHLLRVQAANTELGRFEVYMGLTSSCPLTPWTNAVGTHTPELVERMEEFNPKGDGEGAFGDPGRHVIFVRATDVDENPYTDVWICNEPSGRTFTADNTATALVEHTTTYEFEFRRTVDGVARGVRRRVVFPPGAAPRIR